MKHHGLQQLRGMEHRNPSEGGRFGRMFPGLSPLYSDPSDLEALGRTNGPIDDGGADQPTVTLPLGYAFFGQFVDHDITLDTTSSFDAVADPDAISNFRTPALDLDCVYGRGPEASPFLYDDGVKLTLGNPNDHGETGFNLGDDLPRAPGNKRALIGDPRNDENRIVSQLQLAMLKFHNAVVDHEAAANPSLSGHHLFVRAQRTTRWHYQWAIVHDFLPRVAGRLRTARILAGQRRTGFRPASLFMPVEFSVAAYHFGHSLIPSQLSTNDASVKYKLFEAQLGPGFAPVTSAANLVNWRLFFDFPGQPASQRAMKLDGRLAHGLMALPVAVFGSENSLALRNLKRGLAFRLPSGEAVAQALDIPPIAPNQLFPSSVPSLGQLRQRFRHGTPLWFFILREAELVQFGEKLGPVGGRIVAETIIALLERDAESYLGSNPQWKPTLPRLPGKPAGNFDVADLLGIAGA